MRILGKPGTSDVVCVMSGIRTFADSVEASPNCRNACPLCCSTECNGIPGLSESLDRVADTVSDRGRIDSERTALYLYASFGKQV